MKKLKNVKKIKSPLSRKQFGFIFDQIAIHTQMKNLLL